MTKHLFPSGDRMEKAKQEAMILQALSTLDRETPGDEDINYKPLYYGLFNGISTILEQVETYEQAIGALKRLQNEAEDAYMTQGEN